MSKYAISIEGLEARTCQGGGLGQRGTIELECPTHMSDTTGSKLLL